MRRTVPVCMIDPRAGEQGLYDTQQWLVPAAVGVDDFEMDCC